MTTVLVVDDCLTDRRRAGGLLRRAEYQVAYAGNGREALDRLAEGNPDAIVTDLQMPELDGLGLVTAVARDYPLIPVVVVTSQPSGWRISVRGAWCHLTYASCTASSASALDPNIR